MIHRNPTIDTREYFALNQKNPDLITASRIKRLKNPFREKWDTEDKLSTASFIIRGDLVDCLWLVPHEYKKRFVLMPADAPRKPDKRQLEAKKPSAETTAAIMWWKAFSQKAIGKTIISQEQLEEAEGLVKQLNEHPDARRIHDVSEKQIAAVSEQRWFDKTYPTKILIDLLPEDVSEYGDAIVDLKIYSMIEDDDLSRHIENLEVHVRAAHYLDTFNSASDIEMPRRRYILIVMEPTVGEIRLIQIDDDDIEDGRQIIKHRIGLLESFRANGEPRVAHHRGITTIARPKWAKNRDLFNGITEPLEPSAEEIA